MDFTSAWFLLVMVVVGGGIAVLADNLGRKLGKSRLRVGKLRPRHTAMLFTAISGALVALISIVLVAALSAEVREWIIKGRTAAKQASEMVKATEKLEREMNATNAQLNTAREELNKSTGRIEQLRKQLKLEQTNVKKSQTEAGAAETRARAASAKLHEREIKLAKLSKDLQTASATLHSVESSSRKLNETYRKLNANYRQLDINYKKLSEDIEGAYKQDRILREQNMNLEASNTALQGDINKLNSKISDGLRNLGDLNSRITAQERTLQNLQQTAFAYREGAIGARTRPIIYNLDQEITRSEVGLALTYTDAEQRIRSAINIAYEEVFNRTGLKIGLREVLQQSHTSDEIVGILARQLLDQKGPAVITVSAATNIFGDEEGVPVKVEVRSNPIVFKKGEVLGEARIPGDQTVEQIISAITLMLQKQVREKAVQARMHGVDDPNNSAGRIDPAETIKVVNAINAANRPVRVQAVAKNNTRASGPLEIEFRVR